jgi:hypothetical protein
MQKCRKLGKNMRSKIKDILNIKQGFLSMMRRAN